MELKTSYVLLETGVGKNSLVINGLRKINVSGSMNAYRVTGPYDLIIELDIPSDGIRESYMGRVDSVVQEIRNIPGVIKTLTCFNRDVGIY